MAEFGIHPQGRLNLEINLKCVPKNTDLEKIEFIIGKGINSHIPMKAMLQPICKIYLLVHGGLES